MKDTRTVRADEKFKRASTIVGNGGLALLVAGLSRWYGTGLDLTAMFWIVGAVITMSVSVQVNELLEPEDV